MRRQGVKHHIVLALYINQKPMTRVGIHGELPGSIAPSSIDSISTALTNTHLDGYIEPTGEHTWQLTEQGERYAAKHVELPEVEA